MKINTVKNTVLVAFLILMVMPAWVKAQAAGGGAMKLSSPEFQNKGSIPAKFTCDGDNVNPGLVIEGIPGDARSMVLIVDDPDAPAGTWVHWVVYDIPVIERVGENSVPGKQGFNNSGGINYDGPCPPSGAAHRYFFKIYALDTMLNLEEGLAKEAVEKAMTGHILARAELMGLYRRGK